MDDNVGFWNRCAPFYARFQEKRARKLYETLAELIAPRLNPGMNVLELGCGTGQLSLPLAPRVDRWVATDFSLKMIGALKKRTLPGNLCLEVQDATRLPYRCGQFDAVLIANTLHVLPEPEKALAQVRRVLKKDGVLIAPTFVKDRHQKKWQLRFLELLGFRIYHNWTAQELSSFVEGFSFVVESRHVLRGSPSSECLLIARRAGEQL